MTDWTLTGKTALVVVHMQNAICKSPSPLDFMGHQRATAEDGIIPHVADLLAAFRSKDLPVIYIVAVHPDEPEIPAYGGFWRVFRDCRSTSWAPATWRSSTSSRRRMGSR